MSRLYLSFLPETQPPTRKSLGKKEVDIKESDVTMKTEE